MPCLRLLLAALILVLAGTSAANTDAEQARRELSQITQRLNDLSRWFTRADRQQVALQRELQQADQQIANTNTQIARAEQQARSVQQELQTLAQQAQQLSTQRDAQAKHISQHLVAAARLSGEDFFKLLLNQEDPAQLDRMVRYHQYFSAARLETLQAFQATLRELESNAERTRARRSELDAQIQRLQQSRQTLQGQRQEREALLAKLAQDRQHHEQERERLNADQQRLERLLTELTQRTQVLDGTAFGNNRGRLPWPASGQLVYRYGQDRAGGRLKWQGIFIAADEGAPVQAVFHGRVAFADWLRGFGLLTIIDHGGGQMTLYAHADALYKQVGDQVEAGETIAAAGRSGGQDRSGLYFEVRVRGKTEDPVRWLARR